MNMQTAQELWTRQSPSQPEPRGWAEAIVAHERRERRQAWLFRVFLVIGVLASFHFFYESYLVREEHLIRAVLNASLSLLGAATQVVALRALRRKQRLRQHSAMSQTNWLQAIEEDLKEAMRGLSAGKLGVPLTLVLIMVATLKVWDYQAGTDTLAECVGIVVGTALVLGVLALAAWHYREQHLLPKLRHYQTLRNVSI